MIGKMKSNISLKDTLAYNIKDGSQIVSIINVAGESWSEIEIQMLTRQKLYEGRAKNLTAHVFLSPSIMDGRNLTLLDWKEIAQSFLKKARLENHQVVCFLHRDRSHFHLHLVACRVESDGSLYRHKNELALSQRLGDEIAKERGMTRASEILKERKFAYREGINADNILGSVNKIRIEAYTAAKSAFIAGNIFVPQKYFETLVTIGYRVKGYFKKDLNGNPTSEIFGYALAKKGDRFVKASTLGKEFNLETLAQGFEQGWGQSSIKNRINKNQIGNILRESFIESVQQKKVFDPQNYFDVLRSKGYVVREHFKKDTGKLWGYGIEIESVILNSSEIGIEFTLTKLKKSAATLIQQDNNINNDISLHTQHKYFPESKGNALSSSLGIVSLELIRAIDLTKIETVLKEIVDSCEGRSVSTFMLAIEEMGYMAHLRYDKGELAGYVVHRGPEHYLDKEIGNGKFSLGHLIEVGFLRGLEDKTNQLDGGSSLNISKFETEHKEFEPEIFLSSELYNISIHGSIDISESERKRKMEFEEDQAKKRNEVLDVQKRSALLENPKLESSHFVFDNIGISGEKYSQDDETWRSIKEDNVHLDWLDFMKEKWRLSSKRAELFDTIFFQKIQKDLKNAVSEITGKAFNQEKYLAKLKGLGYQVKEHVCKETGVVIEYGIVKDGVVYDATDFGKEYTLPYLKSPERMEDESTKMQDQSLPDEQNAMPELELTRLNESSEWHEPADIIEKIKIILVELTQKKYDNLNEYFVAIERVGLDFKAKLDKKSGQFESYEIGQNGEFYDASDIGKQFIVDELRKSILKTETNQILLNQQTLRPSI